MINLSTYSMRNYKNITISKFLETLKILNSSVSLNL